MGVGAEDNDRRVNLLCQAREQASKRAPSLVKESPERCRDCFGCMTITPVCACAWVLASTLRTCAGD